MMKRLFAALLLSCAALCGAAEIILAENGKTEYVIVRPDKMAGVLQKELSGFARTLQQITGAGFRIVMEKNVAPGQKFISFGNTAFAIANGADEAEMAAEMFAVKSAGSQIIINGKDHAGKLFGLYEFLQEFAGCRYFDQANVVIPSRKKLIVPEMNIRRAPSFRLRRIFGGNANRREFYETAFALKKSYHPLAKAVYGTPGDIHTFYDFSKNWPKNNLKLLAMAPNGKRRRLIGRLGPNFCLTNPEARRLFKENLYKFIKSDRQKAARYKYPAPVLYNLSQNDSSSYFCWCPDCSAIIKKHGQSGLLLEFINDIARDVAKKYPEIILQTSAYSFSKEPPKSHIKAEKNVIVDLAHNVGNFYEPIATEKDPTFRNQIAGWSHRASQLSIWDYWIFYWDSYPEPYTNVRDIKNNLKYYFDHGVRMIRAESQAADISSFYALKHYLGYKLMDDITRDDRELVTDFMKGFYGNAAKEMEEYLDYLTARQRGNTGIVFSPKQERYKTRPRPWLDREFYARTEELFNRAEAKCATDERTLINVRRERLVIDLSLLHNYDNIRPAISREALIERYGKNSKQQIETRFVKANQAPALLKLENELEMFRRASEITALKKAPVPEMDITRGDRFKDSPRKFMDNRGFAVSRNIYVQCRLSADGKKLHIRLLDSNLVSPPKAARAIWNGDSWEIMLSDAGKKIFFQLMIPPSGKYLAGIRKNGFDKIEVPGLTVKSNISGKTWQVDVEIPLASLPVKNICYGNFFRGGEASGYAWSPTFEASFGVTERFGKLNFK
ncbi:MAG: DUF4838 domain-containing protein [Lentisphaeria bacterium]|nr:DUF4838 domain-containing protein [Lentisphaeria bacterium]